MEHSLEQNANFKRFDIPLKFGLLIAILKIILSTVLYQMFLSNWTMSVVIMFISFALSITLLVVAGIQQRKAMGGYINIKEAFQVMFVAILIFVTLNFLYDIIYMKFIDTSMLEKSRESALNTAERWGAPEDSIEQINKQFDQQEKDAGNIGKQIIGLLTQFVWYGIAGFICAAAISKKRPAEAQ